MSEKVIPLEPDRLSDEIPETKPVKPPRLAKMEEGMLEGVQEREMEIPKKVLAQKVPGKVPPSDVKLPEKTLEKLPEVEVPEKVPKKQQEVKDPEKGSEKRPKFQVHDKVPEKQPEVEVPGMVPEKQSDTKVSEKVAEKQEVKVSEKRPEVKVPEKGPEKQPEVKVPGKQPEIKVPKKVPKKQPEVKAPEKLRDKCPELKAIEKIPEKQSAVTDPEKVPEKAPSKVAVKQQLVIPFELIVGEKQSPETKPSPVEIPVKIAELKTEMVSKKHRETISVEQTTKKVPGSDPQVEEPLPKGTAVVG